MYDLSWGWLWAFHLERIEVRIEIYDTVPYEAVGPSVAIHEFDFEASTVVFVATIDDKLEGVIELWVFGSLLDNGSCLLLIGKFHIHVRIHAEDSTGFMLNNSFM